MTTAFTSLLPPLPPDEFQALKEDIRLHGVLVPIEKDEDGNLLDGAHRTRAVEELRAEGHTIPDPPVTVRKGLGPQEKIEHALTLNLTRRQLSREQRKELVRDLRKQGMTLRRIADLAGIPKSTVADYVEEEERPGRRRKKRVRIRTAEPAATASPEEARPQEEDGPNEPDDWEEDEEDDSDPDDRTEAEVQLNYARNPKLWPKQLREFYAAPYQALSLPFEDFCNAIPPRVLTLDVVKVLRDVADRVRHGAAEALKLANFLDEEIARTPRTGRSDGLA